MKKRNAFKKAGFTMAATLLLAITFSACKKDKAEHIAVSGLVAFNLVPDVDGIGISVDKAPLTNGPISYSNFTGTYRQVGAGTRELTSYVYSNKTPLAEGMQTFKDSAYYSLFVMGTAGHYQNIFVQDKFDNLPEGTGNAFIRYVNGIAYDKNSTVHIASGSTEVFDDMNNTGAVSEFKAVAPGDVQISVAGDLGSFDVSRTINFKKDGVYTIVFTGQPDIPADLDSTKAVKITFVQNGTIGN